MEPTSETVQRIPRLSFAELTPEVQSLLRSRVERLGYLGEFFQCTGHQPDVLAHFMALTDSLKKALPDRLTEVGALTVARVMSNDYERNQHERLSLKLGFGKDWVADVEALNAGQQSQMSPAERAVQRLVLAAADRHGKGVGAEFDAVVDAIGMDQAIAILFLIGRYITHAIIVNTLDLAPPVPSIFGEETPK